jgi:hypothetical protein
MLKHNMFTDRFFRVAYIYLGLEKLVFLFFELFSVQIKASELHRDHHHDS